MIDLAELRLPDGTAARVPFGVLMDAWLAWLTGDWTLDAMTTAGLALSRPEGGGEGEVITELRGECRRRLGLDL